MRKIIKGLTITVASAIMFASLSVSSFAANTNTVKTAKTEQTAQMQNKSEKELKVTADGQKLTDNGEKPATKEGELPDGEKPELKDGEKSELKDGDKPEPKDGEKPLDAADASSTDASSTDSSELPTEKPKDGEKPMDGEMPIMYSEDALTGLLDLIENLDDEDLQDELMELYDNLVDALNAEKDAFEDRDLDEDEIEELRTNVQEARDALISALADAGIEYNLEPMEMEEGEKPEQSAEIVEDGDESTEEVAPKEGEPPVNEDGSSAEPVEETEDDNATTNPIKKFGEKVKNFFKNMFNRN